MRVLVTGATGFVGAELHARLGREEKFRVRVALRRPWDSAPPAIECCAADVLAGENMAGALQGVESVVHLAARVHVMKDRAADPLAEFRRVNVDGTLRFARQAAAQGVRRFIFLSSVKVHGESGSFSERDQPAPMDAYGISKAEAEAGLRAVAHDTGMEVVIVRPPLVYGPGVRANFLALVNAVRRGWPLPFASVRNRRSLVARSNLVDFLVRCLEHPAAANETFLISDGEDVSTPDLIRRLARAMNRPARLLPVPPGLLLAAASLAGRRGAAQRLIGSLQVDIRKARELLQWTPPIGMDEALRSTVRDPA